MIRLFIIEDHATMVVSSLRFMFRPERDGIKVAGHAGNPVDALSEADPAIFDLFVLDLYIPGHSPVENIHILKRAFPGKPVLIYTSEISSSWKIRMRKEGAMAYVTKDAGREELKLGIEKAAAGEPWFPGVSGRPDPGDPGALRSAGMLRPVQQEAVQLLAAGMEHKHISEKLGISRSAVEVILKELRERFCAKNNIELIRILIRENII